MIVVACFHKTSIDPIRKLDRTPNWLLIDDWFELTIWNCPWSRRQESQVRL
jgi:hypothetical protein